MRDMFGLTQFSQEEYLEMRLREAGIPEDEVERLKESTWWHSVINH